MTKKASLYLVFAFLLLLSPQTNGQNESVIRDDVTVDPDQNKKWRDGQYPYSAKPKSRWELGVHAGHAFISGDVESPFHSGLGFGLHLLKAINYTLSFRFDTWYTS
jgi:hypothetical protein